MIHKTFMAFLLTLFLPITLLAQKQTQLPKLGIVPLSKKVSSHDVDAIDAVTSIFLETNRFEVLERTGMNRIMEEMDFTSFTQQQAIEFGQLAGLDLIAMVSYTEKIRTTDDGHKSTFYDIRVRIVQVSNSKVIYSFQSGYGTGFGSGFPAAVKRLSESVRKEFKPVGLVVYIQGREITVSLGKEHGIKKGDKLEVFSKGEIIYHPKTKEILDQAETVIDTIKVIRVKDKTAICKADKKHKITLKNHVRFKRGKRNYNPLSYLD